MSSCAGAGMHRCMRGVAWGGGKTISIIKSEPPEDGRGTQITAVYNEFIWIPLGPGPKRLQAGIRINTIPL